MDWLSAEAKEYMNVAVRAGYDPDELSKETARIATERRTVITPGIFAQVLDLIRERKIIEARQTRQQSR